MQEFAHEALKAYIRHFPISRGKQRLLNLSWKALSFGRYERTARLRQADIKMYCNLQNYLQRYIYFYGGYEAPYCDYWIHLARKVNVIFDIGANVGIYSLIAAATNPSAQIHTFEPTPEIFALLKKNIQANNLRNIILNRLAVGSNEGSAFLHYCEGDDGSNEGMNFVSNSTLDDKASSKADLAVNITSLDSYCASRKIETIDLLKIDVEGGEYNVLLGATNLLNKKSIRVIFMETVEWAAQRYGRTTTELRQILSDAGYQLYSYQERKWKPVLISESQKSDMIVAIADNQLMPRLISD